MIDTALQQAAEALRASTRNGDFWDISGPSNAKTRAQIMALLMGVAKIPQSRSGVNALQAEFYRRVGVSGNCDGARQNAFREWLYAGAAS